MSVKLMQGNLCGKLTMKDDPIVRCLTLLDPCTKRVLCKITNPQVKIGGYTKDGANCIDL
jgi:hypothetical protein